MYLADHVNNEKATYRANESAFLFLFYKTQYAFLNGYHMTNHTKKQHHCKPLVLALLAAFGTWASATQAAGTFTGLGALSGGSSYSEAKAVNADGSVVVGFSNSSSGTQAFRWTSAGMVGLGFSSSGAPSYAYAVNADGSVVVGESGYEAFRWTSAGMVSLGVLSGGSSSRANAVNADGSVVVGFSRDSSSAQAFRWTSAGMVGLGFLSGASSSYASAVNADGSVVVGSSGSQAFRWTSAGMVGLGFLSGGSSSYANAVNADGSVVVGYGDSSSGSQAFRWTSAGMVGLGVLSGASSSQTNAVNADGSVVVGSSGSQAFRWTQAGSMIRVQDWLANAGVSTTGFSVLYDAAGVSRDGNTIVGMGMTTANGYEAYIARVAETPSQSSGIVGLTDLANSITQTLAPSSQIEAVTGFTMNGAHHRPLTDMAVGDSNSCAWVSGDAGRVYRSANGYTGLAEVGACHDFAEQGIRVGAGVGSSFSNLSLANNGNSRIQGQYGLAELDWQVPNKPIIASLLGVYGQWDANLRRGYAIAGTQPSAGDTDITAYSLRARLDWQNALHLGQVGISPRVAYTITRTEIDGYQEQGGSAPANFQDQNHTAQEVRVGLTGKYALNEKVTLLGHTEVAHRFDAHGANIQGNINALGFGIGFNQAGNAVNRNWVRLGAEVDYKLSDSSLLNASTFVSSAGQDADMTAAVSYRLAF
jgi:probable HAF family extracellular repeat protein